MLIKEFCEATGLPRDTVRFYVKQGLLKPGIGSRQSNRYQVFDLAQVERARLIKAAQRLGFTLKEIAEFGQAYEARSLTLEDKAELLRSRLEALDEQARLLGRVREFLAAKLRWVEGGEVGVPPMLEPSNVKADDRTAARRVGLVAERHRTAQRR